MVGELCPPVLVSALPPSVWEVGGFGDVGETLAALFVRRGGSPTSPFGAV